MEWPNWYCARSKHASVIHLLYGACIITLNLMLTFCNFMLPHPLKLVSYQASRFTHLESKHESNTEESFNKNDLNKIIFHVIDHIVKYIQCNPTSWCISVNK